MSFIFVDYLALAFFKALLNFVKFISIFVGDTDSRIVCIPCKFANDTNLYVVVNMKEGGDAIQMYLDILER